MTTIASALRAPVRLLWLPGLRPLLAGTAVSYLGTGASNLTLTFAALGTGHLSAVAYVLGARVGSGTVMLVAAGFFADRVSRRKWLSAVEAVRTAAFGAVAGLVVAGAASLPLLVGLAVVIGAAASAYPPSASALVAEVAGPERLRRANASYRMLIEASSIGAPAIVGIAIAGEGVGLAAALVAGCYLASLVCMQFVREPARAAPAGPRRRIAISEIRDVLHRISTRRWLAYGLVMLGLFNFFSATSNVLGPVLTAGTSGKATWGFVLTAVGLGALLGSALAGGWRVERVPLLAGLLTAVEVLLPVLLLVGVRGAVPLVAAAAATGCAHGFRDISWLTAAQESVPRETLGRLAAVNSASIYILYPLGLMLVPPTVSAVGRSGALAVAAIGMAAGALPYAAAFRRTRV